ncbi:MAG: hypothetical protein O2894_03250 [Planctomycetota bacterium]|nr:hypothetical protein [Planctomycetota bacterium]
MRPIGVLALFAAMALVSACQRSVQTFAGPAPATGVATIVPENAYNRARSAPLGGACGTNEVRVRVAGQCLGGMNNSFAVLPGRQDLAVVYVDHAPRLNGRVLATRSVVLSLQAEAGHVYAIRGRTTWSATGEPTVSVWAVDGATRHTVATVVVPAANTLILEDEDDSLDDL